VLEIYRELEGIGPSARAGPREVDVMSATPLHTRHGIRWAPETRLGTWALSLTGLALGGTVALAIAFSAVMESAESFSDNWLLTAAGVAILTSAAASGVTGLMATIRRHDHSWLVLSATGVGVLLTALSLQQVAEGLGWMSG
jgi:hypothetical protein